jgi:hypothetical protein
MHNFKAENIDFLNSISINITKNSTFIINSNQRDESYKLDLSQNEI